MNGWAISQRLKQISKDILQVSDGSLYPALHKLEQEGWVTAEYSMLPGASPGIAESVLQPLRTDSLDRHHELAPRQVGGLDRVRLAGWRGGSPREGRNR